MRLSLAALAFILAACTPPQTEAPQAEAPIVEAPIVEAAPGTVQPASANAAALSATPIQGADWDFRTHGDEVSASLGYPMSEYVLSIGCNSATKRVSFFWEHDLHPPQDTTLRIITATQTVDIPARSFLEGYITAELDGADPRLDALNQTQERFALEVAGQASVVLWDERIAGALMHCGV